jgi:hypothetical protein
LLKKSEAAGSVPWLLIYIVAVFLSKWRLERRYRMKINPAKPEVNTNSTSSGVTEPSPLKKHFAAVSLKFLTSLA